MRARLNNPAIREVGPFGFDGRMVYELVDPLTYFFPVANGNGGIIVEVPVGYQTDFASVPRILWPLFPPTGVYSRAAIVHDFLYSEGSGCSRFLADAIFRDLMAELGTPLWRRVAMYYAVRLFGWVAWGGGE